MVSNILYNDTCATYIGKGFKYISIIYLERVSLCNIYACTNIWKYYAIPPILIMCSALYDNTIYTYPLFTLKLFEKRMVSKHG